jgi:hypothetical protein
VYGLIFWLYILDLTLLIIHEMDSVYWHEWKLFNMRGGKNLFLVLHLLFIPVFLYGMIPVRAGAGLGIIFAVILSFIGIILCGLHGFFFFKRKKEFRTPFSIGLLAVILIVSILQIIAVASIKVS